MRLSEAYDTNGYADRLMWLRQNDRRRRMVVLGGILIGLGIGSWHWFGLVLGGIIVGLPARTIPRGLLNGMGLGVIGLLVFAGLLFSQSSLGPMLETGTVGIISVAIGLGAPLLGSLVRAVV